MAECSGTPQDVADQLNSLGETNEGLTDVNLCENGCFNLEGMIISPGDRHKQVDTDERKWFKIGFGERYTAADIKEAFPSARQDCPGARPGT